MLQPFCLQVWVGIGFPNDSIMVSFDRNKKQGEIVKYIAILLQGRLERFTSLISLDWKSIFGNDGSEESMTIDRVMLSETAT